MKIILLSLLFLGSNFHDIQVAYYKIHQEEDKLEVAFIFEKSDLLEALGDMDGDYSDKKIHAYVNKNFALTINGKRQKLSLSKIENKHKHVYLTGTLTHEAIRVKTIDIKNTCLVNIEDQSNIVEIRLNEMQRDFLMNKERTQIQVSY